MMDAEVIDRLWDQMEPTVYITRDQFVRGLADWDVEAVRVDGKLAFAALVKGPEFHFASFETGAPIRMAMIRSRLDPIIERHGYVTTRTPIAGADRQHRFNRAFGFEVFGQDEFFLHYKKDRSCR
jgi:hypothetical protein